MHASTKAGNAPFGTLPSSACGGKEEHLICLLFWYQGPLTFSGGGPGAPLRLHCRTPLRAHGSLVPIRGSPLPPLPKQTMVAQHPHAPVAHLDVLVSFFASCSSPAIVLGLIGRIARSDIAVGPKQNRFTVLHGSQQ